MYPDTTSDNLEISLQFQAGEHHHKALLTLPRPVHCPDFSSADFQHELIDFWQQQHCWFGSVTDAATENYEDQSPAQRLERANIRSAKYKCGDGQWLNFSE